MAVVLTATALSCGGSDDPTGGLGLDIYETYPLQVDVPVPGDPDASLTPSDTAVTPGEDVPANPQDTSATDPDMAVPPDTSATDTSAMDTSAMDTSATDTAGVDTLGLDTAGIDTAGTDTPPPTDVTGTDTVSPADVVSPPDQGQADTSTPCAPDDADCDGIPEFYDPDDNDPAWPGKAKAGLIYINTPSSLYSLDIDQNPPKLLKIGDFAWPDTWGENQMTDIAIDGANNLFGLSFDRVYRCSAINARCESLKAMSYTEQYNGLAMLPRGTIEEFPESDVLVAIKLNGDWMRVDVTGATASLVKLGNFNDGLGGQYRSAGDAYSIYQGRTLASVLRPDNKNYLVEVDPVTGAVTQELGVMTPYVAVWGLAGNRDGSRVFGFDQSGCILEINPPTEAHPAITVDTVTCKDELTWWGAAVTTFSLKPY